MLEFQTGTEQDKDELVKFANHAFGMEEMGFEKLVPKVYGDVQGQMGIHQVLREDGIIVGLIGIYEMEQDLAGDKLHTGYIGTVCVAPEAREKGYMKLLMQKAEDIMKEKKAALGILHGDRKRYQYYGYEYGGIAVGYETELNMLIHLGAEKEACTICLRPLCDDKALCGQAYQLYQKRLVTGRQEERFCQTLEMWGNKGYAVLKDGEFLGYISINREGNQLQEIELKDYRNLAAVLYACMVQSGVSKIRMLCFLWEREKRAALDMTAEECIVRMAEQYRIFDYESVLTAYLKLKRQYTELETGTLVLEIKEEGKYLIQVEEDDIHVKETDEEPDISLEAMEAVRTLTSWKGFQLMENDRRIPRGWFPLPFGTPAADAF